MAASNSQSPWKRNVAHEAAWEGATPPRIHFHVNHSFSTVRKENFFSRFQFVKLFLLYNPVSTYWNAFHTRKMTTVLGFMKIQYTNVTLKMRAGNIILLTMLYDDVQTLVVVLSIWLVLPHFFQLWNVFWIQTAQQVYIYIYITVSVKLVNSSVLSFVVLVRAIHCLSKLGNELHIVPTPNGLTLKSVNSCQEGGHWPVIREGVCVCWKALLWKRRCRRRKQSGTGLFGRRYRAGRQTRATEQCTQCLGRFGGTRRLWDRRASIAAGIGRKVSPGLQVSIEPL